MSKKTLGVIAACIILVVILIGGWLWYQASLVKTFQSKNLSFRYANSYETRTAPKSDSKYGKTLVRLTREKPVSVIEVNHEKGAIIGASFTKTNFLDYLERSANKALPLSYDKFKKLKDDRVKLSGQEATRIDYSYLAKDKKTTMYMSLFIAPHGNDAFYLYVQSAEKSVWMNDADRLQSSVVIRK